MNSLCYKALRYQKCSSNELQILNWKICLTKQRFVMGVLTTDKVAIMKCFVMVVIIHGRRLIGTVKHHVASWGSSPLCQRGFLDSSRWAWVETELVSWTQAREPEWKQCGAGDPRWQRPRQTNYNIWGMGRHSMFLRRKPFVIGNPKEE